MLFLKRIKVKTYKNIKLKLKLGVSPLSTPLTLRHKSVAGKAPLYAEIYRVNFKEVERELGGKPKAFEESIFR